MVQGAPATSCGELGSFEGRSQVRDKYPPPPWILWIRKPAIEPYCIRSFLTNRFNHFAERKMFPGHEKEGGPPNIQRHSLHRWRDGSGGGGSDVGTAWTFAGRSRGCTVGSRVAGVEQLCDAGITQGVCAGGRGGPVWGAVQRTPVLPQNPPPTHPPPSNLSGWNALSASVVLL